MRPGLDGTVSETDVLSTVSAMLGIGVLRVC